MKGLRDLLADEAGRDLLGSAGIVTDPAPFLASLAPPAAGTGGQSPRALPIYVHQQPSADYRRSVVAKLQALDHLRRVRPGSVDAVFVLIDTDRAASHKSATRVGWETPSGRRHMLKLTPPGTDRHEFRHLIVDRGRLGGVFARLNAYLRQLPFGRREAQGRLEALQPLLVPPEPITFGRYAAEIGDFLLAAQHDVRLRSVTVSGLADDGLLAPALAMVMAGLDGFIAAFNARVMALRAHGIDSAVAPLASDYLPLFYSCPVDGRRLRLRRRRIGGDLHAVAESSAGRRYAFPLGSRGTSLDALVAAGRWSPDVVLPVLLNDRFSGMVAGRSSALYSLVLATAMRESLGIRPIPVLVPAALRADLPRPDGLLQTWLTR